MSCTIVKATNGQSVERSLSRRSRRTSAVMPRKTQAKRGRDTYFVPHGWKRKRTASCAIDRPPREIDASCAATYAACFVSYNRVASNPPAASTSGRNHIAENNPNAITHAARWRNVRICSRAMISIGAIGTKRSEEHTSELQSRQYLV